MSSRMSASAGPLPIEDSELVVSRVFNAPRELVWKAWTDPFHAKHWWGPPMCPAVEMRMDVRVGGEYRHTLKSAADGSLLEIRGVFKDVSPPERLAFSFSWDRNPQVEFPHAETLVTVTFEERDGGTLVTLRHVGFQTVGDREGHDVGWTGTFDRFEIYATQMAASGA